MKKALSSHTEAIILEFRRTMVRALCDREFCRTGDMINDYAPGDDEYRWFQQRIDEVNDLITIFGSRDAARAALITEPDPNNPGKLRLHHERNNYRRPGDGV
jgi:hypothetical protein